MENKHTKIVNMLPLRGVVVYPTVTMHLDVGREKSITSLESAMATGQVVFLTNQTSPTIIEPSKEDLYEIGTLALVKQLLKLPNGNIRVFVEGLSRARMLDFIDQGDHYSAVVVEIKDEVELNHELEAKIRVLKDSLTEFLSVFHKMPKEEIDRVMEISEPGQFVDHLAHILPITILAQQSILELPNVIERVSALTHVVVFEREINNLKSKIDMDVKAAVDEHQKDFFLREQLKVIQRELNGKDGRSEEFVELEEKIINAKMPEEVKEKAIKELNRYEMIPQSSPESSVIRNYVTWLTDLPWSKQKKTNLNLSKVQQILDKDHYGLEKVKDRLIEFLAVQKMRNDMKAPILCLVGPPGVGKTSIAKSIAGAQKRDFVRVSLGGVRDEAEIRGHRRTYIGAMPGRIIQGMKKAGTNNPVFLLDEIDKMANDFRGDPASAMLEVLDPEQNHTFSDHYIEEAFDLSKVMFIATANSLETIPGPLRDRMDIIELSSYTEIEKFHIAKNHLVPKQMKEHGLAKTQFAIQDEAVLEIIRHYTREAGVRSLERQIGTLCRKATRKIVDGEKAKFSIDKKQTVEMLGKEIFDYNQSEEIDLVGVATGLAYTAVGGDTLQIEVSFSKGKGKLLLTGKLGDVMKESAQTAFSYVRSKAVELGIDEDFYETIDIHIHVPEGAVPKDGPSAGVTITTALVSALTNKPVDKTIGMTGEVTLRGRVLPIGGLKEKSISAHRAGLKTIICPKRNEKDLEDIPEIVRNEMNFVFVTHVDEVLKLAIRDKVSLVSSSNTPEKVYQ